MTHPMDGHPTDELLAYATGELSPEERRRVAAHLETCTSCSEEIRDLEDAYVALVESLPSEAPPPRVWAGIESRIAKRSTGVQGLGEVGRASRQVVRDEPAVDADRAVDADQTVDAARDTVMRPPSPPARPRGRRAPAWQSLAVAASLLVGAVGVLWGVDRQQAFRQVHSEQAVITRWLTQPDVTTRALPIDAAEYGGSVLFRPDGRALVVMREPAPPRRSFQAWGIAGDTVRSLGVIDARTLEVPLDDFDVIAVSLEPEGGSPTPTEVLGGVPAS